MFRLLRQKILSLPHLLVFVLAGVSGGLLAGILGEVFMHLTSRPRQDAIDYPKDIIVIIDTSGSMSEDIDRVSDAFKSFVSAADLSKDRIALVVFSSKAAVRMDFTSNKGALIQAVNGIVANGETEMAGALLLAQNLFKHKRDIVPNEGQCILFFTDGEPTGSSSAPIRIADELRQTQARIVAVGTNSADVMYLTRLTNDPKKVIMITEDDFQGAFLEALNTINSQQVFDSTEGIYSMKERIVRSGVWVMILSVFIVMLLIISENIMLENPLLSIGQTLTTVMCGGASGFVSGLIGQLLYESVSARIVPIIYSLKTILTVCMIAGILFNIIVIGAAKNKNSRMKGTTSFALFCIGCGVIALSILGRYFIASSYSFFVFQCLFRLLSWGIWGAVLTLSCGLIIPNLKIRWAAPFGALGGIGCCIFYLFLTTGGDNPGVARVFTSIVLGLILSLLICLMKKMGRNMYVEVVNINTGAKSCIDLGKTAVVIRKYENDQTELSLDGDELRILNQDEDTILHLEKSIQIGDYLYHFKQKKGLSMGLKSTLHDLQNKDENNDDVIKKPDDGMDPNERKRQHGLTPEQKKELLRRQMENSKGNSY